MQQVYDLSSRTSTFYAGPILSSWDFHNTCRRPEDSPARAAFYSTTKPPRPLHLTIIISSLSIASLERHHRQSSLRIGHRRNIHSHPSSCASSAIAGASYASLPQRLYPNTGPTLSFSLPSSHFSWKDGIGWKSAFWRYCQQNSSSRDRWTHSSKRATQHDCSRVRSSRSEEPALDFETNASSLYCTLRP
jgi:hypothetical protein